MDNRTQQSKSDSIVWICYIMFFVFVALSVSFIDVPTVKWSSFAGAIFCVTVFIKKVD